MAENEKAVLVLADGAVFEGVKVGAKGEGTGEVVFNTSMYGYQEILSDPSYAGQMLTFTYPHIGNVGANMDDVESARVHARGVICRELSEVHSNYRSEMSFNEYLVKNNVAGISEVDTRALVTHLRTHGSQMGIISTEIDKISDLKERAKKLPSMEGMDLVPGVTTEKIYEWREGSFCLKENKYRVYSESDLSSRRHVVAIDFGVKNNILRRLVDVGFRVSVVPATTSCIEIEKLKPDAIFLSNGPGDPSAVVYGIETTKALLGKYPLFGICLGHQILGLALGAPTFKLKFGHRGGNHPVRNEKSGFCEISVQNHGFAIDKDAVPEGVEVTHLNLNDNTVEGIEIPASHAFSVQYHPECSPGPHDSSYLFEDFYKRVEKFYA